MKTCWIFYNSFSNKEKIDSFKKSTPPNNLELKFVKTDEVFLENQSNGSVSLIFVKTGKKIELPNFVISLISDEKDDTVGYKILEFFETQNVVLLNNVKSVRLATDKYDANVALSKNGFLVPKTILVSKNTKLNDVDFPFVIKPIDGRKSRGVKIINSEEEYSDYIEHSLDNMFVIQEFIASSYRKDIRAFVFNGRFLGAVQRTATKKTFAGVIAKSIKISKQQQDIAIAVAKLFDLTLCSVDFFVDENNTICEVNANPGYKAFKVLDNFDLKDLHQYIYNYFLSIRPD